MKFKAAVFPALLLFLLAHRAVSQTPDQSQLNNNTQLTGRSLKGYGVFQYFTAGISGSMVQIDLGVIGGVAGSMSGTAGLRIYTGSDTTGALLQAVSATVSCASGPCFMSFTMSVPVTAGQAYTFRFVPGPGISDPYYLQGELPGTYAGGRMGFINPVLMGYLPSNPDLVFRTYVLPTTGLTDPPAQPAAFTAFPNPAREALSFGWSNSTELRELRITDACGRLVRQLNIGAGQTGIEVKGLQRGIYFATLISAGQQAPLMQRFAVY